LFLNSTKTHVQKECDILSDLKSELEKFIKKLIIKDDEVKEQENILKNFIFHSFHSFSFIELLLIIS